MRQRDTERGIEPTTNWKTVHGLPKGMGDRRKLFLCLVAYEGINGENHNVY